MDQIRALKIFSAVVAEGSFAAAARRLDLAPAVVTRAVAELEQHLGVRLLNRSTRRLALTETGATYLQRANRILAELEEADAQAGMAARQPGGTLRILCPPAFATQQLAPMLPEFHRRYPLIRLDIDTPGPVEVADERFDVSLLSIGEQGLQGDFVIRPLASSRFILCAAPDYLARQGCPQTPDELHRHQGLLPAVAAVRRELTLFRGNGPERLSVPLPPVALSTSRIELLQAAALAGLGIAGLPSFMAAQPLREGRLQRVLPDWHGTTLNLYAAVPSRQHMPARTRAFIDFLVERLGGELRDPWLAD